MHNKIFIFLILILTGCGAYLNKNVNPYYFGMKVFESKKLKKPKEVELYNFNEDNLQFFLKQGYKIKAKSAFREKYVHKDWAVLASKQLGTPIMLLKIEYVGSISGRTTLPFVIPGEEYTVTSNANANLNYNSNTNTTIIGNYGYAIGTSSTYGNATYNSSTTTTIKAPDKYGFKTVQYENHYYDYYAVFLVKDEINYEKNNSKKYNNQIGIKKAKANSSYYTLYDIDTYSTPYFSNENINGKLKKDSKFLILEVGVNYYKIKYKEEITYIYNAISLGK